MAMFVTALIATHSQPQPYRVHPSGREFLYSFIASSIDARRPIFFSQSQPGLCAYQPPNTCEAPLIDRRMSCHQNRPALRHKWPRFHQGFNPASSVYASR